MSNLPSLPLVLQKEIEQQSSWEGISTPQELASFMARVLSVDPKQLLQFQEAIYSDVQPTGVESKKLWIKTNQPIGIGIPSGDSYEIIYQYPKSVPFLWIHSTGTLPSFARYLNEGERSAYGLVNGASAAWAIH